MIAAVDAWKGMPVKYKCSQVPSYYRRRAYSVYIGFTLHRDTDIRAVTDVVESRRKIFFNRLHARVLLRSEW